MWRNSCKATFVYLKKNLLCKLVHTNTYMFLHQLLITYNATILFQVHFMDSISFPVSEKKNFCGQISIQFYMRMKKMHKSSQFKFLNIAKINTFHVQSNLVDQPLFSCNQFHLCGLQTYTISFKGEGVLLKNVNHFFICWCSFCFCHTKSYF